jgi:hypothetical protein
MIALRTVVLTLAASLALWNQVGFVWRDGLQSLPSSWRFWDDLTLGIARYVDATTPGEPRERDAGELAPLVRAYRAPVEEKVGTFEVQPHQFWRTVNDQKFRVRIMPYAAPRFEDPGRSLLLSYGFRLLGGVAPYLLLWLGALSFLPVLGWVLYELTASGRTTAAAVLAALLSFSPYIYESLTLPHSAVAFYLGALTALGAFGVAVLLRPEDRRLSLGPVAMRALMLSAVLIVAIWCRSGTVFFIPAALLAAAIGFSRAGVSRRRAALLAFGLVLLPILIFRPHKTHNVWLGLWEGLGDFGMDRGYSWYDTDANKFLARQGVPQFADPKDVNEVHEAAFRKAFLDEVVSSPGWYARVLLQRAVATVAFTKLAPYGPRDGESRSAPLFHYKYTMPIDWFGWKESLREVPVSVLWAPTLAFLAWGAARAPSIRGEAGLLGLLALAALPLPVLITTAGGLETQAFGLVYFFGVALLVQRLMDATMRRFSLA